MITYNIGFNLREYLGTHTVYMVTTINGVRKFKSTKWKVKPKEWDQRLERVRESHINFEQINKDLAARKQALISTMLDAQLKGKQTVSLDYSGGHTVKNFVEAWVAEVKGKRSPETIENNLKHLRKLTAFAGEEITFKDIDSDFLRKYETHIRKDGKDNSTYVTAIWKTLKKWFNAARKKGITDLYPFDNYENPTYNPDEKDYLTLNELDRWEVYAKGATGEARETAVYFLLGCYSGLRISDWFRFSLKNIRKDQISIRTQKNQSYVSIPIHRRLKLVLDLIKNTPLTITEPYINRRLKKIANHLKIKKHLSSHSGRKTFAVTMCAERGISSETCAEIMGITISVCVKSYYRVTPEKVKYETSKAWEGI